MRQYDRVPDAEERSDAYLAQVAALLHASFEDIGGMYDRVLGQTDDIVLAESLEAFLRLPDVVIASVLGPDGKVRACSISLPLYAMDPTQDQAAQTAYIYAIAVDPDLQRHGYGRECIQWTVAVLQEHGYILATLDCRKASHMDALVHDTYGDVRGAIVETDYPEGSVIWPEVGPECHFTLDLPAATMPLGSLPQ